MPDPKLKTAMEEVKAILVRHDIAAIVNLVSQTHSEFLNHISPSWTCAKWEGQALRIRAMEADFPSKADRNASLNCTINMIGAMADAARDTVVKLDSVMRQLRENMDIQSSTHRDDLLPDQAALIANQRLVEQVNAAVYTRFPPVRQQDGPNGEPNYLYGRIYFLGRDPTQQHSPVWMLDGQTPIGLDAVLLYLAKAGEDTTRFMPVPRTEGGQS